MFNKSEIYTAIIFLSTHNFLMKGRIQRKKSKHLNLFDMFPYDSDQLSREIITVEL